MAFLVVIVLLQLLFFLVQAQIFQLVFLFRELLHPRLGQRERLYLRIGQHIVLQISHGALVAAAAQELGDEPLLALQDLPRVGVEAPLRDIAVDADIVVFIARFLISA